MLLVSISIKKISFIYCNIRKIITSINQWSSGKNFAEIGALLDPPYFKAP